jgi:hypothetical protein
MDPGELWSILSDAVRRVSQKTQGDARYQSRGQYSVWVVLRVYLLAVWLGVSPRTLFERIQASPGFRRRYGLPNRLISLSQFKKRLKTREFLRALLKLLEDSAVRALRDLDPRECEVLLMDLTSIPSNPARDPHGRWGWDSKGLFFGYKLGLIVSKSGVILGMTLRRANRVEFHVQKHLQRFARAALGKAGRAGKVRFILADAGFDGEKTYQASKKLLGATALIPARRKINPRSKSAKQSHRRAQRETPHRFEARQAWDRPERKVFYGLRGEIERVNSQLKNDRFRIHEIPRRGKGILRMQRLILAKLLIYNFTLNVNARCGLNLRDMAWSAA